MQLGPPCEQNQPNTYRTPKKPNNTIAELISSILSKGGKRKKTIKVILLDLKGKRLQKRRGPVASATRALPACVNLELFLSAVTFISNELYTFLNHRSCLRQTIIFCNLTCTSTNCSMAVFKKPSRALRQDFLDRVSYALETPPITSHAQTSYNHFSGDLPCKRKLAPSRAILKHFVASVSKYKPWVLPWNRYQYPLSKLPVTVQWLSSKKKETLVIKVTNNAASPGVLLIIAREILS